MLSRHLAPPAHRESTHTRKGEDKQQFEPSAVPSWSQIQWRTRAEITSAKTAAAAARSALQPSSQPAFEPASQPPITGIRPSTGWAERPRASLAHALVGRRNGCQGVQPQLQVVVPSHKVVDNAHVVAASCIESKGREGGGWSKGQGGGNGPQDSRTANKTAGTLG